MNFRQSFVAGMGFALGMAASGLILGALRLILGAVLGG